MNRQEFMRQLELLLSGIPASEREDALAYYNNYFDEAGVENEAQVIAELGSPEAVAKNIIADVQQEGTGYSNPEPQAHENQVVLKKTIGSRWKGMNQSTKILLILLLVFTFPLWIGIVAGIFGAAVGILGAVFGVAVGLIATAFGLLAGGIACIVAGIARFVFAPIEALVTVGVGAILISIGILLALLCIWILGMWGPKLVKVIVKWVKGLLHRNKGGNEI